MLSQNQFNTRRKVVEKSSKSRRKVVEKSCQYPNNVYKSFPRRRVTKQTSLRQELRPSAGDRIICSIEKKYLIKYLKVWKDFGWNNFQWNYTFWSYPVLLYSVSWRHSKLCVCDGQAWPKAKSNRGIKLKSTRESQGKMLGVTQIEEKWHCRSQTNKKRP